MSKIADCLPIFVRTADNHVPVVVPVGSVAARRLLMVAVLAGSLTGCGQTGAWLGLNGTWLPSVGPSTVQVVEKNPETLPLPVIALNRGTIDRVLALRQQTTFADTMANLNRRNDYPLGPGDRLEISVWEAPPAVLFNSSSLDPRAGTAGAKVTTFPEETVAADGTIDVPFAGSVPVNGLSPTRIAAEVVRRLAGKANQPQVTVRVTSNVTANVTIVGEVVHSTRMPLSAKGERLLDALAMAGGTQNPVGQTTIQLSRDGQVGSMPLDSIIRDPQQNIPLQPGDVITALFKSHSFTALGAIGKNEEIQFEAQGITLAQALGRIGGLQTGLADPRGVFIFRFEDPGVVSGNEQRNLRTPENKVPVIYQVDLKNPATFLLAQQFPIQDKDVIYVSTAPAAELQAFINIISSSVYSVTSVNGLANQK